MVRKELCKVCDYYSEEIDWCWCYGEPRKAIKENSNAKFPLEICNSYEPYPDEE